MKKFLYQIGWQIRLLAKYQILTVAMVIAAAYALVLYLFPALHNPFVVVTLIFADPTGIGFIFVGAMILFEKGDRTLEAQVVTPMSSWQYIFSKMIALTVPALAGGIAIALMAYGWNFQWIPFIFTLMLSSMIFTSLGIAGAIRVKTLNQYFLVIPAFLAPAFLPSLNFYGVTNWQFLAALPTHSTFQLFAGAFGIEGYQVQASHLLYLLLWVGVSAFIAKRQFEKALYS